jgi:FlaA1/EpsC-like NDP-sugar epimerase
MTDVPASAGRKKPIATNIRVRYLMLVDLACIMISVVMAFTMRYDSLYNIWPYIVAAWTFFILVPLVRLPVYYGFRLYYRLWRYASTKELLVIATACVVSSAIIAVVNFGVFRLAGIPYMPSRSVFLMEGMLSFAFLGGTRFLLRLMQERSRPQELTRLPAYTDKPTRILIAGAGDAGAMIVRELQGNAGLGYKVVGLVDDDPDKLRYSLNGVPVLGNRNDIPAVVEKHGVDQIIIAMPTASGKDIRDIVRICDQVGVTPYTIPGIYELLDGTVSLNQVRHVELEDLLRRDSVETDIAAVQELLRGKRVLVTGGGGSIGSELCRQILRCRPAELVLLGHGENSIFEEHGELLRDNNKLTGGNPVPIRALIADIRFQDRIHRLFREIRPHVVFHAAAHKHVPLMEENPAEAITNNVLGTRNLLDAAQAVGVERFVMISTDKAVNPTSIMGASKRSAELLVHEAASRTKQPYVAVRFGNVLGSRGSVVLTFRKQIAAGGPITVTHPDVKRYFMTIPEAVQLVLQAGVLGTGGEVFLLDMGEPVRIVDLARDMLRLSGLEEGRDIDIVFTGMRPGEKLFEELFVEGEDYKRTQHDKIFIAANASSFVPDNLAESILALEQAAEDNDRDAIVRNLQHLIPEFTPQEVEKPEEPRQAPPLPHSAIQAAAD